MIDVPVPDPVPRRCRACGLIGHRSDSVGCPARKVEAVPPSEPAPTLARQLSEAVSALDADIDQHERAIAVLRERVEEARVRRDELAAALRGARAIGL